MILNKVLKEKKKILIKKMAMYHQYYGVNDAIRETLRATGINVDKKIGTYGHTQGSGKSLSMVFYTGKLRQEKNLENPTIVVITDRNDLDDQLYETFCMVNNLIAYPVQLFLFGIRCFYIKSMEIKILSMLNKLLNLHIRY